MYETSGRLTPVVEAYLNGKTLSPEQVQLMRAYLRQWIDADVWECDDKVAELRRKVREIESRKDIEIWLDQAMEVGIDPL
jgi:hypothetical protein